MGRFALLGILFSAGFSALSATFISGVNPELHTFNSEDECGTGAVVPWAGSLWAVSYAPHAPNGSTDLLYEIRPDFSRIIHREVSIGGTPANRLIHRESNQLFIGPYAIDARGRVRVMPPVLADGTTNLFGRLTASARHLTDPARKIYQITMEEGFYEVDVDTLEVKEIFRDANIGSGGKYGGDLIPGWHGKGGYSGQGRLVYANNGEFSHEALSNPAAVSGVLAQWDGRHGNPSWETVLRNQFTDITSKGGIYGATDPVKDPLWAIGWDYRSVILMVLEDGQWHKYRLPKGSHSYDGAHGWNTEWPRIREIGEGDDYLMTMHGTFWRFPATMSSRSSAGIRPRSNYLKVVGDFCRWGDKVVLGCDDTARSEFINKRRAKGRIGGPKQSNSSLWFLDPADLDTFGPVIGRGAVWQEEDVEAGAVSDPYLLAGYDRRTLYVKGALDYTVEVDVRGDGEWTPLAVASAPVVDLSSVKAEWIRLVARNSAKGVTAFFNFANRDMRRRGVALKSSSSAILRSGKGDEHLPLEVAQGDALYRMTTGKGGRLELARSDDPEGLRELRQAMDLGSDDDLGDGYDAASACIVDNRGRRWRFPYATEAMRGAYVREGRLCRECCTERDMLNLAGVFYELPAENAGGYAKARALSTPGASAYDYCTWRGLFVISGMMPQVDAGTVVVSDDGKVSLWVGVADDLWRFGKPVGVGGPWKDTPVRAGEPSDPYLMTGFDRKAVTVSADRSVGITLEIDLTGTGVWTPLRTFDVKPGTSVSTDLGDVRAYWVRAVADGSCTASVQFVYE